MTLFPIKREQPGLFAPGLVVMTGGVAADVKKLDENLVVVFNGRVKRFEVYDRAAPGGPRWQMVMRVQEPDGSFRALDGRVLETLRRAREESATDVLDRIERQEEIVERHWDGKIHDLAEGMASDMKYVDQRITTTVAWRDRTPPEVRARLREEIRRAA